MERRGDAGWRNGTDWAAVDADVVAEDGGRDIDGPARTFGELLSCLRPPPARRIAPTRAVVPALARVLLAPPVQRDRLLWTAGYLPPVLQTLGPADPTVAAVSELVTNDQRTPAARSTDLCSLLTWAVRQGKLPRNPLDTYELPEGASALVPGYAVEEISGMLAARPEDRRGRRDYAVLTFGYATGVRTSEPAALQVGDVDLAHGTAAIRRSKGGRGRNATFGPTTAVALRRYLSGDHYAAGDQRAPLFEGAAGKPLGRSGVYSLVKQGALAAGVEGRKGRQRLRHRCAMQHLLHGGNARTTQEQLGRADLAMVERSSAGLRMEARRRQWQRTRSVEGRLRCQTAELWPRRPLPGRRVGAADPARAGGHAGDVARCKQAGMDGRS